MKKFPSKSARVLMDMLKLRADKGVVRGLSVDDIAKAANLHPRYTRTMLRELEARKTISTHQRVGFASSYTLNY